MKLRRILFASLLASTALCAPAHAGPVAAAVGAIGGFLASGTTAAFIARIGLSLALSALGAALSQQPEIGQQRAGIKTDVTQSGGTNGQKIILGRYASAGALVAPPYSQPNSGEIPNRLLTYVVSVCDIPGVTLNRLIVDGQYVDLEAQSEIAEHDLGGLYQLDAVEDDNDYHVYLTWHDGTQTTADAYLLAHHGTADEAERPWLPTMVGDGVAYATVTFRWHDEIYSGLPGVLFEVDGIPLYDPRKDTSVGGSGTHRWGDYSTYEQTNNPLVMVYNIKRGIDLRDAAGNVYATYGGGADAEDLPLGTWFAAMNACDEAVGLKAGGTEPRYRAGIEIDVVEDEPAAVEEKLLAAASAEVAEVGGVYYVRVGGPGLPVLSITDDDIIVDDPETLLPYQGLTDVYNGITATFPDPDALWEASEPVIRTNATWEAEDGDRQLMATVNLDAVPYIRQVRRLSKAWIEDERRMRQHQLTLPPEAAFLTPLDSIDWTSARNGYTTKIFEVTSVSDDLTTCLQSLNIRERDDADFNWDPATDEDDVIVVDPTVPDVVARSVPGWAVSAVGIVDHNGFVRRPGIKMSWTANETDDAGSLRFQIRPVGQTVLTAQGSTTDLSAGEVVVADGLVANANYEARGRLRIPGRATIWTAWTAVTTGDIRFDEDDFTDAVTGKIDDAVADSAAAYALAQTNQTNIGNAITRIDDAEVAIDNTINVTGGTSFQYVPSSITRQQWTLAHDGLRAEECVDLPDSHAEWDVSGSKQALMNDNPPTSGSSVPIYSKRAISVRSGEKVSVKFSTGHWSPREPQNNAIRVAVIWLNETFTKIGESFALFDLGSSYLERHAFDSGEAPAGTSYARLEIIIEGVFSSPPPGIEILEVAMDNIAREEVLDARITSVLALDVDEINGTAFAARFDAVEAEAGANTAGVSSLQTAMAGIDGNSSSIIGFSTYVDGAATFLEMGTFTDLGDSDSPTFNKFGEGAYANFYLDVDTIILDGTVFTNKLVVASDANMISHGAFHWGDLRGWSSMNWNGDGGVREKGNAAHPTVTDAMPATHAAWCNPSSDSAINNGGWQPCKPSTAYQATWDYAVANSSSDRTFGINIQVRDKDGVVTSRTGGEITSGSNTWAEGSHEYTTLSDSVEMRIRLMVRGTGNGTVYMTNCAFHKKNKGATIIEEDGITTDELAALSVTSIQLAAGAVTANKVTTGELITLSAQIKALTVDTINIANNAIGREWEDKDTVDQTVSSSTFSTFLTLPIGTSIPDGEVVTGLLISTAFFRLDSGDADPATRILKNGIGINSTVDPGVNQEGTATIPNVTTLNMTRNDTIEVQCRVGSGSVTLQGIYLSIIGLMK